jgi:hypothetical protein
VLPLLGIPLERSYRRDRKNRLARGVTIKVKLALFGAPGAGKSTSSRYLVSALSRRGFHCTILKIAEPLYELQRAVYGICERPLRDPYTQDGMLLQALGMHVRRIDSDALLRHFDRRLDEWDAHRNGLCCCICDDVRAPDAAHLRGRGFRFIEVVASDAVRRGRLAKRGDLALGRQDHELEARPSVTADVMIENSGTHQQLERTIDAIVAEVAGAAA